MIGRNILKKPRSGKIPRSQYKPLKLTEKQKLLLNLPAAILYVLNKDFKGNWANRSELRKFIKSQVSTSEINSCVQLLNREGFVETKFNDTHWPHLFSEVRITSCGVRELAKLKLPSE